MNDFRFDISQELRGRAQNGRIVRYKTILGYEIPALDFDDPEAVEEFEDAADYFEDSFFVFDDLDIVTVDGRRMYGCEYKFYLAEWITETARALGATISGSISEFDAVEEPQQAKPAAPRFTPQIAEQQAESQQKAIKKSIKAQADAVTEWKNKILGAFK